MFHWLVDHWAVVALVASEAMSFLPSKVKGITQFVIKVGDLLFTKKK